MPLFDDLTTTKPRLFEDLAPKAPLKLSDKERKFIYENLDTFTLEELRDAGLSTGELEDIANQRAGVMSAVDKPAQRTGVVSPQIDSDILAVAKRVVAAQKKREPQRPQEELAKTSIGVWEPTLKERFRNVISEKVSRSPFVQPGKRLGQLGIHHLSETVSGLGLYIPDILASKLTKEDTLASAVDKITGFEPTPRDIGAGEAAKFVTSLQSVGRVLGPAIAAIPARPVLQILLGSGVTFGGRKATEELAKKISTGKPIDVEGIHFEGGIGVLFGAGQVGVSRFIQFIKNIRALSKAQIRPARAAANRALKLKAKGKPEEWEKIIREHGFGQAAEPRPVPVPAEKVQVREFGKYPIARPIERPYTVPPKDPSLAVAPRTPPQVPAVPREAEKIAPARPEIVDKLAEKRAQPSKIKDLEKLVGVEKPIQKPTDELAERIIKGSPHLFNAEMTESEIVKAIDIVEKKAPFGLKAEGLTKDEVKTVGAQIAKKMREAQKLHAKVGYKKGLQETKRTINIIREQARDKLKSKDEIRNSLTEYVKNNVSLPTRGKMINRINRVASRKNLDSAIALAERYVEQYNQRVLKAQVLKEIKRTKPKKKEGLLKGKYTADIQRQLNSIRDGLLGSRAVAQAKIASNISQYEEGKLDYETMSAENDRLSLMGLKGMTAEEMQNTLDTIKSLKETGKTLRQAKKEQEDARINSIRERTVEILTGGKGTKKGAVSVPRRELEARKTVAETVANWQYGWDNYMDKISKYEPAPKSKMYESDISKFSRAVHESHNSEIRGISEQINKVFGEFKKIFDVKTVAQVNKVLNSLKQEVDLGVFSNADGDKIRLKLTKEQLIKKYQELQDPTLEKTFAGGVTEEGKSWGMRWTDEIKEAVKNSLSPQEKAWADYHLKFYQEYYPSVNDIYREIYGVDLPHNLYYSPIGRDIEADIPESVLLAKESAHYASAINGSLKSRTANALPLKFNNADSILVNHITKMEHFKAWANTIRDMRRVFGNKEVRTAIRQYHGANILKKIDEQLNQMARGGVEKAKINRGVDYLRRNFTLSILGLKPVIGLKQIPSVIAYSTEMPFPDFISGVADFWTNPIKNVRFLRDNSPYFKQRWKAGFERDIRFAMKKGYSKRLAGKGNVRDWFMSLIRAGDKFATMQGGWAKYQSALNEGKSQVEAIAAAEQSTKRTQPSFSLESLSPLQRGGSWMKLFTMFQNQPNKYFRIIADNARNMRFGRQTKAKGTANMLTAWIVLPMLFQYIADALQFKKKHQLRAAVLGPINHLLVIGQLAQSAWGWMTKEPFDYQASPVFSTGRDLQIAVTKSAKIARDGMNPYKDISMEDIISAIEYYGQAAGKLTGIPTPYAVQAERAARETVEPTKAGEKRRKKRMPGWRREPAAELIFSPWALETEEQIKAMTEDELHKAIEDNTYKGPYRRKDGVLYPKGHPYSGREEIVARMKKEFESRKAKK